MHLKKLQDAVILAHYYQRPEIQDIADVVGDSLVLAKAATQTDADTIVLSGVYFMAETAKILNPHKTVLIPEPEAGCSLVEGCPPGAFREFVDRHPGHVVVTYINSSAEVKAISDIICTSSNALTVLKSIPKDQPVIFAPDKNLGRFLAEASGRELVLWDAVCVVHQAFALDRLKLLREQYPDADLIAHPESDAPVLEQSAFVGSTSALLKYVQESPNDTFIIGTEAGILHKMKQAVPLKKLIPVPTAVFNACACSECPYMKMNTLEKLRDCLRDMKPEVTLPPHLLEAAARPLKRMMELA